MQKYIEDFSNFINKHNCKETLHFFVKKEDYILTQLNDNFNDFIKTKLPKNELLFGMILYNSTILEKNPIEYYKYLVSFGKNLFIREINKKKFFCTLKEAFKHNLETSLEEYKLLKNANNLEKLILNLVCYMLFEQKILAT